MQSDIKHFPFRISNKDDKPAITVEVQGKDRSFSPEEVSAMVLGKMKEIAESYLGKKVIVVFHCIQEMTETPRLLTPS